MWTRIELKEKAKVAFRRNYWKCVLAGVIMAFLTGGFAGTSSFSKSSPSTDEIMAVFQSRAVEAGVTVGALLVAFLSLLAVVGIVVFIFDLFVFAPLRMGVDRFFLVNTQRNAEIGEVTYAFAAGRYLKIVGANFLKSLFVGLGTLLFIIPGVILEYSFLMVPYILADNPQISAMDCIRRSSEMMKGHKWDAFVLTLSFLGWGLLSAFTFGIAGIFYVTPYINATMAELYVALKGQVSEL